MMRMNQHSLPRERSLDRLNTAPRHPRTRERSLDRSVYLRDDPSACRDRETMIDDPYRDGHRTPLDRLNMSGRHVRGRERSLDRSGYMRDDPTGMGYRDRETIIDDPYREPGTGHRGTPHSVGFVDSRGGGGGGAYGRDSYIMELQARLNELQNQYSHVKRELDATTQKLGSSMHSVKTFWSPELKKERALRKEEAAKHALLNDQLKILRSENQVSIMIIILMICMSFIYLVPSK